MPNTTTNLSTALGILSAMITPAVLISACGSLIIATSGRLTNAVARTREVYQQFEELAHSQTDEVYLEERSILLYDLLERAVRRARLLQRALACLYLTLSDFVATSVSLGVFSLLAQRHIYRYAWIPILLGMMGAALLFYTTLLLIAESGIALTALNQEMDFVLRYSQKEAPPQLLKHLKKRKDIRFFARL